MGKQRANNGSNRGADGRFIRGRWKPGQSGNPAGRPPVPSISRRFRELLEEDPKRLDSLATALFTNAQTDARFFKLAIEYLDGKVPEVLRVEEHVIQLLPPGVARGKFEVDDGDSDDPTPPSDAPPTSGS